MGKSAFRISKYDPALRDSQGKYTPTDWTSASDIGRVIGGMALDADDYREVEDRYVRAALALSDASGGAVRLTDLEDQGGQDTLEARGLTPLSLDDLSTDEDLSREALERVIRLALREVIWCRAVGGQGYYLHFGYDYLMYAGGDADFATAIAAVRADGLYVERKRSPHG